MKDPVSIILIKFKLITYAYTLTKFAFYKQTRNERMSNRTVTQRISFKRIIKKYTHIIIIQWDNFLRKMKVNAHT